MSMKTEEVIKKVNADKEKLRIEIMDPEVIFGMGKIAKTHKAKGLVETEEEREERKKVLTYCLAYIALLPQAPVLNVEKTKVWLEKSYAENPEKTLWHVVRLSSIGGSDMGVLYAATEGDQGQSPFETPARICLAKWLETPIGEDNIHTSRGTRMESYVRDIFLKDLANNEVVESTLSNGEKDRLLNNPKENPLYGAVSILDEEMEKDFVGFYDPEHPWLGGNPDEVLRKANGDIVIVDYKAPVDNHGQIPDYYLAQMQHYAIIFKKKYPELADKVKTIALASFDYRAGARVAYTELPISQEIENKILKIGDMYWNEYVLKRKLPKAVELGQYTELEDTKLNIVERDEDGNTIEIKTIDFTQDIEEGLVSPDMKKYLDPITNQEISIENIKDSIEDLIARYSSTRHLSRESEAVSEDFSFTLKRLLLNKLKFEDETDTIRTPTANISITKRYHNEKLIEDLKDYWKKLNISEDTLNKEIFNNKRAYLTQAVNDNAFVEATENYLSEKVKFYVEYTQGVIEKTDENQKKYEDLSVSLLSDMKTRANSNRVSPFNIPEFEEALDFSSSELSIDYLISFTKRMDPTQGFPFREYIDYNASDITIRLRQAKAEKDLEVYEGMRQGMRDRAHNIADEIGLSYVMDRRAATGIDVEVAAEKEKLEAEQKELEKEQKRLAKEEEKLQKEAEAKLEKERLKEEKAKEKLGNVASLTKEDKAEINDEAASLLGKPAPKRKIVKGL